MLKNIVFIIIISVVSIFSAQNFCSQLEVASATKARRDPDKRRRHLELGRSGRAVLAAVLFTVMLVIGVLSKFPLIAVIIALAISAVLVVGNVMLMAGNIYPVISFFLLWIGVFLASLKNSHLTPSNTWGVIYVILQLVAVGLLFLSSFTAFSNRGAKAHRKARRAGERLSSSSEGSGDESEGDEGCGLFNEQTIIAVLKVVGMIAIVVVFILLGFWLEVKFDFFPPYTNI